MSDAAQESPEINATHFKTEISSETLCRQLWNKNKLHWIYSEMGKGAGIKWLLCQISMKTLLAWESCSTKHLLPACHLAVLPLSNMQSWVFLTRLLLVCLFLMVPAVCQTHQAERGKRGGLCIAKVEHPSSQLLFFQRSFLWHGIWWTHQVHS